MGIGFSAVMGIGLAIYGLALFCFVFIPNGNVTTFVKLL
jgi:hypothetical protein